MIADERSFGPSAWVGRDVLEPLWQGIPLKNTASNCNLGLLVFLEGATFFGGFKAELKRTPAFGSFKEDAPIRLSNGPPILITLAQPWPPGVQRWLIPRFDGPGHAGERRLAQIKKAFSKVQQNHGPQKGHD